MAHRDRKNISREQRTKKKSLYSRDMRIEMTLILVSANGGASRDQIASPPPPLNYPSLQLWSPLHSCS